MVKEIFYDNLIVSRMKTALERTLSECAICVNHPVYTVHAWFCIERKLKKIGFP